MGMRKVALFKVPALIHRKPLAGQGKWAESLVFKMPLPGGDVLEVPLIAGGRRWGVWKAPGSLLWV